MVYNDITNKSGILQMIEQTTNLGDGNISGVTLQKAYFTNLINQWYRIAGFWIWRTDKNWHFDDTNFTNLPIAYTMLVDNRRDYEMPAAFLIIRQVEVMNSNGDYYTLNLMSSRDSRLRTEKMQETSAQPTDYRIVGRNIILYPNVDINTVTAAAGLRATFDREVDVFTVSDTTQEPGFDAQFHPILYYGPSYEWAMVNDNKNIAVLCERMLGRFNGLKEMVEDFHLMRDLNDYLYISRAKKSFR